MAAEVIYNKSKDTFSYENFGTESRRGKVTSTDHALRSILLEVQDIKTCMDSRLGLIESKVALLTLMSAKILAKIQGTEPSRSQEEFENNGEVAEANLGSIACPPVEGKTSPNDITPKTPVEASRKGSFLGDPRDHNSRMWCPISSEKLFHINLTCKTAEKMVLKLLDSLFTKDELAQSNISGKSFKSNRKSRLNPYFIFGIKAHLQYKFNITEKDWHRLCKSIDSKCRSTRNSRKVLSTGGESKPDNRVSTVDVGDSSLYEMDSRSEEIYDKMDASEVNEEYGAEKDYISDRECENFEGFKKTDRVYDVEKSVGSDGYVENPKTFVHYKDDGKVHHEYKDQKVYDDYKEGQKDYDLRCSSPTFSVDSVSSDGCKKRRLYSCGHTSEAIPFDFGTISASDLDFGTCVKIVGPDIGTGSSTFRIVNATSLQLEQLQSGQEIILEEIMQEPSNEKILNIVNDSEGTADDAKSFGNGNDVQSEKNIGGKSMRNLDTGSAEKGTNTERETYPR